LSQGGVNAVTLPVPPIVTALGGGIFKLEWTGTVPQNVTVPTGGQISLTVSDFDSSYSFNLLYDSKTYPSQVQVATATGIDITSLGIYDSPYPAGTPLATTPAGVPAYVRVTVSDPFGASDITSADLVIKNSSGATVLSTTLTSTVASTAGSKTYELGWTPPTGDTFSLAGYGRVFTRGNFLLNYRNSLIVTTSSVLLTVVFSTLAAYALVEYRVRIVPFLAGLFVVGVMLPIRLGTIPIIQMMVALHINDTLLALILVYTAMSVPLGVTLMMTYFRTVPPELKEAARVDGAGEFRTFRIVLPLVRPGLAAVATVTMLPVWNDLWFPLILAPGKGNQTVTLGVQQFVGQFLNDYPALLAALTLGAVPLIVLFTIFSRQFIRGLSAGYGK